MDVRSSCSAVDSWRSHSCKGLMWHCFPLARGNNGVREDWRQPVTHTRMTGLCWNGKQDPFKQRLGDNLYLFFILIPWVQFCTGGWPERRLLFQNWLRVPLPSLCPQLGDLSDAAVPHLDCIHRPAVTFLRLMGDLWLLLDKSGLLWLKESIDVGVFSQGL